MSRNFRPVKTIWGEHSSCFLPGEVVADVLSGLGSLAGCEISQDFHGDVLEVWIDDGKKFLTFIQEDLRAPLEFAAELPVILITEEEAKVDGLSDADFATGEQFVSFIGNLRVHADRWLAESLDPRDGSLRFYID
jgi:hypothetical protein